MQQEMFSGAGFCVFVMNVEREMMQKSPQIPKAQPSLFCFPELYKGDFCMCCLFMEKDL